MPDYRITVEGPKGGTRLRSVKNVPSALDAERSIRLLPGETILDICQLGSEPSRYSKDEEFDPEESLDLV